MTAVEITDEQARALAARWAPWHRIGDGDPVELHELPGPDLDACEREALLARVGRAVDQECRSVEAMAEYGTRAAAVARVTSAAQLARMLGLNLVDLAGRRT